MNARQQSIFDQYNATGRIAFYYPRKQRIALNGGPSMSIKAAVEKMEICLLYETKSTSTHEECTKAMFDAMEPSAF